ncbi:hypothetical protein GCM10020254_34790 [Streptomyces goshikiensis]
MGVTSPRRPSPVPPDRVERKGQDDQAEDQHHGGEDAPAGEPDGEGAEHSVDDGGGDEHDPGDMPGPEVPYGGHREQDRAQQQEGAHDGAQRVGRLRHDIGIAARDGHRLVRGGPAQDDVDQDEDGRFRDEHDRGQPGHDSAQQHDAPTPTRHSTAQHGTARHKPVRRLEATNG